MIEILKEVREMLEKIACLGNGDKRGNSEGNMMATTALTKLDALIAQEKAEPVAYLKTWNSCGHARTGMKRVDLKAECEPWLANMFPVVEPLYTAPQSAAEPVVDRISESDEDYVDLDDPWQEIATLKGQP